MRGQMRCLGRQMRGGWKDDEGEEMSGCGRESE